MPAGRRGHKIREYQRRIDAVLEKERERRRPLGPPSPPISEEHAALRRQIAECWRALRDPEDPEGTHLLERMKKNPDLANVGATILAMVREEKSLLAEHGVEWRPYNFSLIRSDPPDD